MRDCNGIILVDKPSGVSSFSIVNRVHRTLGDRLAELTGQPRRRRRGKGARFKCGHAGTLDPLATGLLIILVGRGVRLSRFVMGLDKRYRAVVRFGAATDSLDADGTVTDTAPVTAMPTDLQARLAEFTGTISQIPPLISALKRDGQPLYKRVRAGQNVAPPEPRQVTISKLELIDSTWAGQLETDTGDSAEHRAPNGLVYEATLSVECSSGTYVRSLARDLAEAIGTVGHLHTLRRETIGGFSVAEAVPDTALTDADALYAALQPLGRSLPHLPVVPVDADRSELLRHGGQPEMKWLQPRFVEEATGSEQLFQMQNPAGELVAVGRFIPAEDTVRSLAVFPACTDPVSEEDHTCG